MELDLRAYLAEVPGVWRVEAGWVLRTELGTIILWCCRDLSHLDRYCRVLVKLVRGLMLDLGW
jgi:hypothetical protein